VGGLWAQVLSMSPRGTRRVREVGDILKVFLVSLTLKGVVVGVAAFDPENGFVRAGLGFCKKPALVPSYRFIILVMISWR
jgi:hypothetical protein